MQIEEINTRLAEIGNEIDAATGDSLTALEHEVENLKAERQKMMDEIQTRQQLRADIAAGVIRGEIIESKQEELNMENRNYTIDSAEYREAYLLNLQARELSTEQRAAVTASAAIPTQT